MKIRIGILGLADIAFNRFIPSLLKSERFQCVGIAGFSKESGERAERFVKKFGLQIYNSYFDLIEDPSIDAMYLPLPPAVHFEWAMRCIEAGKHILVEKPFTTSLDDSQKLIQRAREKNLAVHENYMFEFHNQLEHVKKWIESKNFGEIRLIRSAFGFPLRKKDDFRYKKELGGGALLDAGGYVVKLGSLLLENPDVATAETRGLPDFEVDMLGSVTLTDNNGVVFQGAWGMDNFYQCSLELWTNKCKISTNRIFTSPFGYVPTYLIETQDETKTIELYDDDHFFRSIEHFADLIEYSDRRSDREEKIINQARMIDKIRVLSDSKEKQ